MSKIVERYNADHEDVGDGLRLNVCLVNGKLAYYAEMLDFECSPISPRLEMILLSSSPSIWFFPENIVPLCQGNEYSYYPTWITQAIDTRFKKRVQIVKPASTIIDQDEYVGWFVNYYDLVSLQGVTQLLAKMTQLPDTSKDVLDKIKELYAFLDSDALDWTINLGHRQPRRKDISENFDGGEFLEGVFSGRVKLRGFKLSENGEVEDDEEHYEQAFAEEIEDEEVKPSAASDDPKFS
jgi:hypothetical protein